MYKIRKWVEVDIKIMIVLLLFYDYDKKVYCLVMV